MPNISVTDAIVTTNLIKRNRVLILLPEVERKNFRAFSIIPLIIQGVCGKITYKGEALND
jgi:hypothetical protein